MELNPLCILFKFNILVIIAGVAVKFSASIVLLKIQSLLRWSLPQVDGNYRVSLELAL